MPWRNSKQIVVGALLSSIFLVSGPWACAEEDARRVEEASREAVDAALPGLVNRQSYYSLESGVWVNYRSSWYRNSDHDSSQDDALRRLFWGDTRLWGRMSVQTDSMRANERWHSVYIRIREVYVTRQGNDPGARFDDLGPSLDNGFLTLDFWPWKVETGRRYFSVGKGFVYSGVHDGLQINYQTQAWNLEAFVSRTPPHASNIDTSVPGYDKGDRRYFSGLGLGYSNIPGHQLYSYALVERDHGREIPEDDTLNYHYQAEYVGVGAAGEWREHWPYTLEMVHQTGRSTEFPSDAAGDISAWALDVEQKFEARTPTRLEFSVEYAFGSGDADRESVTNTVFGNAAGRDTGFLYFGYLPTGIAFGPLLSNMHMLRLGMECAPLQTIPALRSILVGVDYFHYWKNRVAGAVSDVDAGKLSHDIGQEVDLRLDWRPVPRAILSVEWGYFIPGKAFWEDTRARERLLSCSLSLAF